MITSLIVTSRKAKVPIVRPEVLRLSIIKLEHPRNALLSIEVTLSGMVMSVRAVHSLKASVPMVVTVSGMSTEVTVEQRLKA